MRFYKNRDFNKKNLQEAWKYKVFGSDSIESGNPKNFRFCYKVQVVLSENFQVFGSGLGWLTQNPLFSGSILWVYLPGLHMNPRFILVKKIASKFTFSYSWCFVFSTLPLPFRYRFWLFVSVAATVTVTVTVTITVTVTVMATVSVKVTVWSR